MPSNRPEIESSVKKEMIRTAARNIFLENGYEKTSIAKIAKEAKVSVNTIYWYYKDKDELFAAVLEEMIQAFLNVLITRSKQYSLSNNLKWIVDSLDSVRPFVVTVHERSTHSEVVSVVHQKFHESLESHLSGVLIEAGVKSKRTQALITIISFVVEGMLMHDLSKKEKHQVISQLIELSLV